MSSANKNIKSALKKFLVPHLGAEGFTGKFPEFMRREGAMLHLLSVQFHKYGGSFFLEFAPHPAGDKTMSWGEVVSETKLTTTHTLFDTRARLQEIGSKSSTEELWLHFENLTEKECEDLVRHVIQLFPQVNTWLRDKKVGPNISATEPQQHHQLGWTGSTRRLWRTFGVYSASLNTQGTSMFERVNQLVQQLATRQSLVVLLIAYCIYFPIFFFAKVPFGISAIQPYASQGGILDVEFFYSSAQAYERFASFGELGRLAYLHILMGDLIYPALLGGLLAVSLCLIVRRLNLSHAIWQYLSLLPLANMVCDYCENSFLFFLLLSYPTSLPTLATIAGVVTLTKNIFGMLSFAALGCGILAMLAQHLLPRRAWPLDA